MRLKQSCLAGTEVRTHVRILMVHVSIAIQSINVPLDTQRT